jgi:hypothetical protein
MVSQINGLEGMWKEAVIARNFPGGSEENHNSVRIASLLVHDLNPEHPKYKGLLNICLFCPTVD